MTAYRTKKAVHLRLLRLMARQRGCRVLRSKGEIVDKEGKVVAWFYPTDLGEEIKLQLNHAIHFIEVKVTV